MAFIILDFGFAAFFIWLAVYTNYLHRTKGIYGERFIDNVLLGACVSVLLAVTLTFPFNEGLFGMISKLLFVMEAFFLTNVSFYFIFRKVKRTQPFVVVFKIFLLALALYILFSKIDQVLMFALV